MENTFISIKEMQKVLSIGESTSYKLIHSPGFYPAMRLSGKKIVISKEKLEKWIEERMGNV